MTERYHELALEDLEIKVAQRMRRDLTCVRHNDHR